MTNSEKYLKDGVVAKELWKAFEAYYYKNKSKESDAAKAFRNFFKEEIKPTLTEDEKVILRNINTNVYYVIGRGSDFDLYIAGKVDWNGNKVSTKDNIEQFLKDNVFQFIKERRRILY